jgi:hypothetical protein
MYELADDALEGLGEAFVEMMKKKIQQKIYPYGRPGIKGRSNKVASGKLLNSLSSKLIPGKNGEPGYLQVTYANYFEYVNDGRRAGVAKVPIKSLLDWIKIRGIVPRQVNNPNQSQRGRFAKRGKNWQLGLAFAIQKNIFKYGIRPAKIYDQTLEGLDEIFTNPPPELLDAYNYLYGAIEQDVYNLIEADIREIFI